MRPGFHRTLSGSVSLSCISVELLTRCLVQVSVGIEHINDIIADFEEALKVVPSAK